MSGGYVLELSDLGREPHTRPSVPLLAPDGRRTGRVGQSRSYHSMVTAPTIGGHFLGLLVNTFRLI